MDKAKVVSFANVVTALGRKTLEFEEGIAAFKLILWTMEQMKLEKSGEREPITPQDCQEKCDELIREVEDEQQQTAAV